MSQAAPNKASSRASNISAKIFFPLITLLLLGLSACGRDPYLYDKPGFDEGTRPRESMQNPDAANRAPPDYYYQRYQNYPPQGYQQGYAPQPYGVPQGYAPAQPGSRFYSNPYAMPPGGGYYNYYDSDQYYVPPTYYGGATGGSEAPPVKYKNNAVPGPF